MDINLLNQLNCIYKPLWEKSVELNRDLQDLGYETSCGFYNNHSIKIDSDFYTEFFPIPVIFIEGIGDIGIDVDSIWFEVTFSKEKALGLDYHSVAKDYRFEIYGVAGYLDDIYNEHTELSDIIPNLMGNSESAFHISFYFEQSANDQGYYGNNSDSVSALLPFTKICLTIMPFSLKIIDDNAPA